MFKRFEVILDTNEFYIEVTGEDICIKTQKEIVRCTPSEVLDSPRYVTYEDMVGYIKRRGESVSEYIKNWYLRA